MKAFQASFPFLLVFFLGIPWSYLSAQVQEGNERTINRKRISAPEDFNDLVTGLHFYEDLWERDLENADSINAIYDLRLIAMAHHELGYYYESESYATKALRLIDENPFRDTLRESKKALYNQLGRTYKARFDYNLALAAYQDAFIHAKNTYDSITLFNNQAGVFKDRKSYTEAKNAYQKALNLGATVNHPGQYAMVLTNFGEMQSVLSEKDAISHLYQALQIRKDIHDLKGLYNSYSILSQHFNRNNNLGRAQKYADSALAQAKQLNSLSYLKDALGWQIRLGNTQAAEDYKKVSDSLDYLKQAASNKYAALRYDVEKEHQIAEDNKMAKEKEKRLRLWIQGVAILLLITGAFVFYFFRNRQKQKEQQQVLLTENRISKKVHDEVANEVYGVMTQLQDAKTSKKIVLDQLELIYNKTRDISKEHNPIDYGEDFGQVLSDLILTYQSHQVNIITRNISKIDWTKLNKLKKTVLYRVLQELLTNMKKHSKASVVALSFNQNGKRVWVEYADNGHGCELKKKGGLLNTENRIDSIGGTLNFETAPLKGFKAKITV